LKRGLPLSSFSSVAWPGTRTASNIYKFSSYLTGITIHLRCVARNSDHQTTEAVYFLLHNIYKFSSYLTGITIHIRCVATRAQRRSITKALLKMNLQDLKTSSSLDDSCDYTFPIFSSGIQSCCFPPNAHFGVKLDFHA
jgi:hypothetical protein